MKKNLLLLSSLIFTATLGQAAWAAPLYCVHVSDEEGCYPRSYHLELDLENESFKYTINYESRCGWPPAPQRIKGNAMGALNTHLGVVLTAENFYASVTGNPLEVSFDDGRNIYPMSCR